LRRRLRRRFGIAADQVSVRVQRPWYLNVIGVLVLLGALAWAARWGVQIWQATRHPGAGDLLAGIESQQARIAELERQNEELRATVQAGGSNLQIERAAQDQLSKQVTALSEENARLKQDISLFEGLSGGSGAVPQAVVSGLNVEPEDGKGRYRYRLTVALSGGRETKDREFRGQYQLLVKMQQGGQAAIITIPAANDAGRDKFSLRFKQFQRVEGVFKVPENAVPVSVEARLLSEGVTRASKTITL
jgi:hypothetical protein